MKIKKGDNVMIMKGKDRNKSGKVLHVNSVSNKVTVENLNLFKKRQKPKRQGETGEMISLARAMNASNVKLVCSNCHKPVRVGIKIDGKTGKRSRVCKQCDAIN